MLIELLVVAFVIWFAFNATRINLKEGGKKKAIKFWIGLILNILFWVTLFKIFQLSIAIGKSVVIALFIGGTIFYIYQVTRK